MDALFPKIEELWPEKKYKEIGAILTNLKEVHEENIKIRLEIIQENVLEKVKKEFTRVDEKIENKDYNEIN